MLSLTALIRAKPGHESIVETALRQVAAHVAASEPGTVGYHVSRGMAEPGLFLTYERFTDQAAMDLHNNSAAVAAFVEATKDALAGPIEIHAADELSAK